eukprot:4628482-Alexandrium_andersonii.AAC.1
MGGPRRQPGQGPPGPEQFATVHVRPPGPTRRTSHLGLQPHGGPEARMRRPQTGGGEAPVDAAPRAR